MSNHETRFSLGPVARAALLGGGTAAIANLALFAIMRAAGVDFVVQPNPAVAAAPIPMPSFAVAAVVPAILAGFVLLALARSTANPVRIFLGMTLALALVSVVGPLTIGGASVGTRGALVLMHLVTAAVISGALLRLGQTVDR